MKFLVAPLVALGLVLATPALAQDPAAEARIHADVAFLADDALEGRGTGLRGYDLAAQYVQTRMQGMGLAPGANGSWRQPVTIARMGIAAEGATLTWTPVEQGWSLWSSSGWRSLAVQRWREEQFERWQAEDCPYVQGVPGFHVLSVRGEENRSPLASRALSGTRSITQVCFDERHAGLRYWPGPDWPPREPATELTLPLEGGSQARAKPV